jgi:hypothetical protein
MVQKGDIPLEVLFEIAVLWQIPRAIFLQDSRQKAPI